MSKNSNLCDHNPPTLQTDGQRDRQTTCDGNTALCTKVHRAVKTDDFTHPSLVWRPLAAERHEIDINIMYTLLKSAFNRLEFRRWHYRSIFIYLAVVASRNREIRRNSDKIWPYSSSRSSKVIDLGVNRKPICDFLLVINYNYSRICYRFWDIHA